MNADLMELCAFIGACRNQLLLKPRNVFPDSFRVGNPLLPDPATPFHECRP
ncbi:hypothetical protein [Mesorhizobium sp. CO1-1-4]|uniref:hypothetical protein n=1 Tax=Mesorhizobium sp. CO1-1-4 TaxID=2876633 RepID=UPI001CCC5B37|nr:hypothetical protein [Mesorhizobium sp. CO1-1-4]MBZ9738664.1 hypothetical protein [Mesorhizobium sp. CO1-1-4]